MASPADPISTTPTSEIEAAYDELDLEHRTAPSEIQAAYDELDLEHRTPTSEIQAAYDELDVEYRLNDIHTSLGPGETLNLLPNEAILYEASPETMAPLEDHPMTTPENQHAGNQKRPIEPVDSLTTSEKNPKTIKKSVPRRKSTKKAKQNHNAARRWVHEDSSVEVLPTFEELAGQDGSLPDHLVLELQTTNCTVLPTNLRRYRCSPCVAKQAGAICAFRSIRQFICKQDSPNVIVGAPKFSASKNSTPKAKQNSARRWVHEDSSIEVLPTLEELAGQDGSLPEHLVFELQTTNCTVLPANLRRYRCSPCVSRQPGCICAFRLIRQFICKKDSPNVIVGAPTFPDSTTHPSQLAYQYPQFPTEFNRLPSPQDLVELRQLLAKILLPAIESELEWLRDPRVKFIGRQIDAATKCDYCSATLIGSAWLCSECGSEACTRCFGLMTEQTQAGAGVAKNPIKKRVQMDWFDRLTTCNRKDIAHGPDAHLKISHITREELDALRDQMLALTPAELSQALPTSTSPLEDPAPYSVPADLVRFLYQPEDSYSESYIKIDVRDLEADPSIFDRLWSAGIIILVTGMSDRLKIDWTPEYFAWKYANDKCQMIESNSLSQTPEDTTVEIFFDQFRKEPSPNQPIWKLRDWPPEADFRNKFPELFYDFEQALPIPDITTRFGIRNVAGHFPLNANMYIAMKNSDHVGSRGSTVLHMDVADAVNIQTYARLGEAEGCALWHLYHAKDSQALREFLYLHQANELQMTVEDTKRALDDPIHTTRIYIDAEMRKNLREKYGVKGWEIKQKPGEAVFIPAYTAHQVCNLANCIKVAADFVSPHSIERCIKLTEEFRVQNHERRKPWREDLLQINQMLLYAFMSTGRNLEEFQVKSFNKV
ncbi:hypothetical protein PtB15_8B13 [Puccinia triticina]|nr:hypothetical protein PtB15_8B13 [Puccinia triticina]